MRPTHHHRRSTAVLLALLLVSALAAAAPASALQATTPPELLATYGGDPAYLEAPWDVDIDADGNLYVVNTYPTYLDTDPAFAVQVVAADGTPLRQWGPPGDGPGEFQRATAIAVDDVQVYVSDPVADQVEVFTLTGDFVASWGGPGTEPGRFQGPAGIDVDLDGNIVVADTGNDRLQVFSPDGEFQRQIGGVEGSALGELRGPADVAVGGDGDLYVIDTGNHRIQVYDADGGFLRAFGWLWAYDRKFWTPVKIAVDANENVYVVASSTGWTFKFGRAGNLLTSWSFGDKGFPRGLTTDGTDLLSVLQGSAEIGRFGYPDPVGPSTITIAADARPDSKTDFAYYGGLGRFRLDDPGADDGDAYGRTRDIGVVDGGHRVWTQDFPAWMLTGIDCTDPNAVVNLDRRWVDIYPEGNDVTCTFVYDRKGEIHARVFDDLDADGQPDPDEPWEPGWTIELRTGDGVDVIASATTDTDGRAAFLDLTPGAYQVCQQAQAGWTNTRPGTTAPGEQPCYRVTVDPATALWMRFGNTAGAAAAPAAGSAADEVIATPLPDTDDRGRAVPATDPRAD